MCARNTNLMSVRTHLSQDKFQQTIKVVIASRQDVYRCTGRRDWQRLSCVTTPRDIKKRAARH